MIDIIDRRIAAQFADVKRTRADLHEYQDTAVEFLKSNPFSALFIDMGLGKTVSSLTVISDLLQSLPEMPTLVIGPLRVVCDTWPTEIGLWQHTAWMSWTLIRVDDSDPRLKAAGQRAKFDAMRDGAGSIAASSAYAKAMTEERWRIMEELARKKSAVHFINRENVEWLCYLFADKWPFRCVFIDESSSFKDHSSKRFLALAKTRRTDGLIKRLHILTATPAAEGYIGLFPQIYLLDLGKRLGKNITRYRSRYFTQNRYTHKYDIREGAESEILEKISDIALVMRRKDYLPTQEPVITNHYVSLEPEQYALIEKLEKELVIELPGGFEIEAGSAAILSSMLLQMGSGTLYETYRIEDAETGDLKKVKRVHNIHDHKITALKEIYEEAQDQGENLLVTYHFKSTLDKLQKAFPKATTMDEAGKCIKPWNAGKIPMLFVHPQSAGHGLNLQHGGSTLIIFDMIYSLEQYLQVIGRLDRQGQKRQVFVKLLVAKYTRDEFVAQGLIAKDERQEAFFKMLKGLIARYRKNKAKVTNDEL